MASSLIVTIMFIVIAKGWLIKYKHMPKAELVIPIALVVLIANTLILAYGSLTDDLHNKFSDYEGTAGIALILLRICLLLWFLYHIRDLYKSAKTSQLNFVISFGFIAMAYFLALPLLVTSSLIFKNYLRTKLVSIGSAIIQIIVFFFLTHLFSETSSFYKISTLSHSVLPGKNN